MIVHDFIQYSPEWWECKSGIPSASNFDRILTPTGKLSAQADDYIDELIADVMCQNPNFFTERGGHTAAMRNGQNYEPDARRYFELETGLKVFLTGFITTDDKRYGSSPDFMTSEDNPGELKCPLAKTHISYLRAGTLPKAYKPQCHGHILVTGGKYCEFMSYCPGLDPLVIRVYPDEYTEALKKALDEFCERYANELAKIKGAEYDVPAGDSRSHMVTRVPI